MAFQNKYKASPPTKKENSLYFENAETPPKCGASAIFLLRVIQTLYHPIEGCCADAERFATGYGGNFTVLPSRIPQIPVCR
ncbi:MAG: hypothetical protein J5672_08330, partial [Verrucomicrobia bacterium]|nr:hypothetical protein [Verrucomicrobiota bacterium]